MTDVVLANTWQTARGPHRCDVCSGTIATGDRYLRQRGIFDSEPYTWKGHALCVAADRQARRELDLTAEEAPDPDEVLPIVRRFFANLTPGGDQ